MVSNLETLLLRSVFVYHYPPSVDLSWSFLRLEAMLSAWVVTSDSSFCDLIYFNKKNIFFIKCLCLRLRAMLSAWLLTSDSSFAICFSGILDFFSESRLSCVGVKISVIIFTDTSLMINNFLYLVHSLFT